MDTDKKKSTKGKPAGAGKKSGKYESIFYRSKERKQNRIKKRADRFARLKIKRELAKL